MKLGTKKIYIDIGSDAVFTFRQKIFMGLFMFWLLIPKLANPSFNEMIFESDFYFIIAALFGVLSFKIEKINQEEDQ